MATTDTAEATTETDDAPAVDDRDPSTLIPAAVDEILELAMTWLAWDGTPVLGDGNAWTPLKALRRITDHLLDHLAEIEATLAGQPTVPDSWLGRAVTLESDWARFTEADLNEASNRLFRYAELYRVRLAGLTAAELDPAPALRLDRASGRPPCRGGYLLRPPTRRPDGEETGPWCRPCRPGTPTLRAVIRTGRRPDAGLGRGRPAPVGTSCCYQGRPTTGL